MSAPALEWRPARGAAATPAATGATRLAAVRWADAPAPATAAPTQRVASVDEWTQPGRVVLAAHFESQSAGVVPAQRYVHGANPGGAMGSDFDPFEAPDADALAPSAAQPLAPPGVWQAPTSVETIVPATELQPGPSDMPWETPEPTLAEVVAPAAPPQDVAAQDEPAQAIPASEAATSQAPMASVLVPEPAPEMASEVAVAPLEAEDAYQESQQAVEDELLRREVEGGAAAELIPENPFRRELDGPTSPSDSQRDIEGYDEPADSLPEAPEYVLEQGSPLPRQLTPEQLQRRREQIERERLESEENCRELQDSTRSDRIQSIDLSIRVPGNPGEDYPFECGLGEDPFNGRSWGQITYLWKASGLCHKPLYFEQVQLERYGHSWGPVLQPIMSGAHFFATVPILPYKMGLQTPQECVYSLGYYRPGSCAPYMIDPLGFTWRAAAFQGAAATAIPFIVP